MTRIALVVSDVDGTLLTKDKTLTDGARRAVRRLHEAGIGFTITSSRPTIGMGFLIEPLQITLPVGPFNGSSIVDPQLNPLEQHLIPAAAAQTSLDLLNRCEAAMQRAVGTQATAIRSQSYYLDVTPPGFDKGTFVQAMAGRQGLSTDAVATIGDMQNDLAMFAKSGMSIAMGNATEDVKKRATHVTTSNEDEGFAGAIDLILKNNAS